MKSETYIPLNKEGWWGTPDTRLRCKADKKVVFFSERDAEISAKRATGRGTAMTHYLGKCGHWHTSRVRQQRL